MRMRRPHRGAASLPARLSKAGWAERRQEKILSKKPPLRKRGKGSGEAKTGTNRGGGGGGGGHRDAPPPVAFTGAAAQRRSRVCKDGTRGKHMH